jgi:hypothetical protein
MADYRVHAAGVWMGQSLRFRYESGVQMLVRLARHLPELGPSLELAAVEQIRSACHWGDERERQAREQVTNSLSWRLTRPLRALRRGLAGLTGRGQAGGDAD